jgi:hypothetical protein
VRSLFYGSPGDFFLKDKAKLGFADYFSKHYTKAIDRYVEVTARRNLLIHNDGRVDRKYLREQPASSLALGQKVVVDEAYLKASLLTLRGLCASAKTMICKFFFAARLINSSACAESLVKGFSRGSATA